MRNIRLILAYDGAAYHGWQVQPGLATIQGHLNEVLSRVTQEDIFVHGAGRTDAGVHAFGQAAHFQTNSRLSSQEFQHALNALLPASIRVLETKDVALDFHARHHATGKTYRYRIYRGRVLPPFLHGHVLHYPGALEEEEMLQAASLFEGEHNFTYFSASAELELPEEGNLREPDPVRTVWESRILRLHAAFLSRDRSSDDASIEPDYELVYRVRGRSFLRYMVRKIAGTLLDVGRGHLKVSDIPPLFDIRDRARSAPTLPPQGLFLESVEYRDSN